MKIYDHVMIIEKFSVQIDQFMNIAMIHVDIFIPIFLLKINLFLGMGQPNGWYADHGNQCRSYYLCTDQRKNKIGECPIGSKWNPHRLRCDDPRYIAAPCK